MKAGFTRNLLKLVAVLCGLGAIALAFPQTGEIALRQIVLTSEQEATEVRASLFAGGNFETVAAERSRDATAQRGGYLGRMRLSDLRSEIQKALEQVAPGEISNPVRVGNTYVLFQVVPEAESRWIDLDDTGAQALADGRNAEAAVRFEQALALAETATLGDVRLARSLDSLAAVYALEGRGPEAEKLYRRAGALLERMKAPALEIAQVVSGLGKSLVLQARFTEAEPLYSRARSIRENLLGPDHPDVAATTHNLADVYAGLGRFTEAANLYEQSQSLLRRTLGDRHPATVAAAQSHQTFRRSLLSELRERISNMVSLSQFRDRDFARTMAQIRELLALAPLSEHSFVQMKNILFEAALTDESEEVLRIGLKKFPESRLLRIYSADLLAETGRTQNALDLLEDAYRLARPDGVDAANDREQRAIIQQRIGDMQLALANFEAAVAAYKRSLELDPGVPAVPVKLGKAYLASNRLKEAVAEFERATAETPNDSEAHMSLSEARLASGQWELAAAAAERAIKLGASDPRALYLLGTALVRTGRRNEGQERLQEHARVEEGFRNVKDRNREISAISAAAIEALHAGDADAAIKRLSEGLMRYPDAGPLQMNLAMVQSRLGRRQTAVEILLSMLEHGIGRRFLIHMNLADEYDSLGDAEASRRHRKIYRDTLESELIVDTRE
jgi:tetratricopeptide (TPR) repeat protein